jgi:hypothetical protein
MENDCAFANLEEKYTFKFREKQKVAVNNVQWMRYTATFCFSLNLKVYLSSKLAKAQSFSMFVLSILQTEVKEVTNAHTR